MAKKKKVGLLADPRFCRQCGGVETPVSSCFLKPTATTHEDTAGDTVRLWLCSNCGHTEGHPDEEG